MTLPDLSYYTLLYAQHTMTVGGRAEHKMPVLLSAVPSSTSPEELDGLNTTVSILLLFYDTRCHGADAAAAADDDG